MIKSKGGAQFALMYAKSFGEVGAGRAVETVDNIIPFIAREDLVPVVVPTALANQSEIGVLTVRGISLENEGIFDGDILIFRRRFTWRQITPDTVCVVYIHATAELVAKKIIVGANTFTLRACHKDIPDREFAPDQIEIKGIIYGFQRNVGSSGSFLKGADS